nr:immunoglobulin heavy chain junction region [Mus musculus]
SEDSAVYYCAR